MAKATPDVVVAIAITVLGAATIFGTTRISVPLSSNVVGPRAFPYAVGLALLVSGGFVLSDALRGKLGSPEGGEDIDTDASTDWVTLARITSAFAAHILLVDLIGWALAGALLFALVAWSLGAPLSRSAAIGLILGFAIQALFVSTLGVTLPAGMFDGVGVLNG